jgi:hypothetical protein
MTTVSALWPNSEPDFVLPSATALAGDATALSHRHQRPLGDAKRATKHAPELSQRRGQIFLTTSSAFNSACGASISTGQLRGPPSGLSPHMPYMAQRPCLLEAASFSTGGSLLRLKEVRETSRHRWRGAGATVRDQAICIFTNALQPGRLRPPTVTRSAGASTKVQMSARDRSVPCQRWYVIMWCSKCVCQRQDSQGKWDPSPRHVVLVQHARQGQLRPAPTQPILTFSHITRGHWSNMQAGSQSERVAEA